MLSVIAAFSGCDKDDDGSNRIFVMDLSYNPRTLDPQTAACRISRMIIANIFEGLLKTDEQGEIIPAVAQSYSVSANGLEYTFVLRQDVYWSDGREFSGKCTAGDFVYAFERLFCPLLRSPHRADYAAVQSVRDSDDYTLIITLTEASDDFLHLMTLPPSFPANKAFVESTHGRYGLIGASVSGGVAVASNGAFVLREWVYDPWWKYENRIILRRNSSNDNEQSRIYPLGVNLLLDRGDVNQTNAVDLFLQGQSALLVLGEQETSGTDRLSELERAGFEYATSQSAVWGFVFRETGGLETLQRLSAHPVLILPMDSEAQPLLAEVSAVSQQWQEQLSLFCRIEPLTSGEFARRRGEGSYDIAAISMDVRDYQRSQTEPDADEFIPFSFTTEHFFTQKNVEGLSYNSSTGVILFRDAVMGR